MTIVPLCCKLYRAMQLKLLICFLLRINLAAANQDEFVFNGFTGANLTLDGIASITSNGLLALTNLTNKMKGHAFYPVPLHFRKPPGGDEVFSFSTTFVFAILPEMERIRGSGLVFILSPSTDFSKALDSKYLGLFNTSNIGNSSNHVVGVELDTYQNSEFQDIDNDHVGIDINGLRSNASHHAGYYANATTGFTNLSLISGEPMQVWVDYDGRAMELNVTLSLINMEKPERPLLSSTIDLSTIITDPMYVGFSSSTGFFKCSHYILGWSFKMNGPARALDLASLPSLPETSESKGDSNNLRVWLPFVGAGIILLMVGGAIYIVRRQKMYAELLEDWEMEYGPHRFKYKDLYRATHGFREKQLLGMGGFGRVYKGLLPGSELEVAVKRVSHESRQGMKEFIAEIVSIGRLRHRNIVLLLGYCRRKGELLLVYDFMPNGSLDKYLYDSSMPTLDWSRRFRIIKGVASGLLYLHEEWEQVVIHRDIKASNVLLDVEMNGRLGDFGLARLYDHGADPATTHIAGTMGYLAPELARSGRATALTDVFAFGAFLLEVACGRRPVKASSQQEDHILVEWVVENWRRGALQETRDPRLGDEYVVEELELVLKLGLLCSHPLPAARPSMRQVMQYLDGQVPLPELSPMYLGDSMLPFLHNEGFDDYLLSYPSSSSTVTASVLSGDR